MKASVCALLLVLVTFQVAAGDEIENRRLQRERQQRRDQVIVLLKAFPPAKVEFRGASSAPQRCADIERYLKTTLKITGEVQSLALLVDAHDAFLVPSRIYRARYERKDGSMHLADFLLQQEGAAEWRVMAHVPAPDGFGS